MNLERQTQKDSTASFFFNLQSIINILKRHFNKHNYSAIQQVFPILKAFNAIQPDFYVTLQVSKGVT